jgi:hypothetical protein
MINTMKEIITNRLSQIPVFWFSYKNCTYLVEDLAERNSIKLTHEQVNELTMWMITEF